MLELVNSLISIYGIVQYQLYSFESNTESNKEVFYVMRCLICLTYMACHHETVVIRKKGFTKVALSSERKFDVFNKGHNSKRRTLTVLNFIFSPTPRRSLDIFGLNISYLH